MKAGGINYTATLQENSINVALKAKIGNVDYKINIAFKGPVDEKKLKEFLNSSSTKEKIEDLVKQHKILEQAYFHRDVKVKLRSNGESTEAKIVYYKKNKDKEKIVRKLTLNEEEIDAELIVLEQRKENVKLKYEATKEGLNALPPVEPNSEEEIRRKKILSRASIKLERRNVQLRKINELKKYINTQPANDFLVNMNFQRV